MKLLKRLSLATLLFLPVLLFSQASITTKEKAAIMEGVKAQIEANFVFIDRIESTNRSIDSLYNTGKYANISDYKDFATTFTADLVNITRDKHFALVYNPGLIASRRAWRERANQEEEEVEEEEEYIDWNLWYAQKENFGFEKVEILDGNVGYIKFDFWQPLQWVQATMDATMSFVGHTDALIIDLRENGGGYSPSDSYLGSYFLEGEPILWSSSYNRRTDELSSDSTFSEVGGARYLDKPLYILVGENTFSLAEKFAYCLKHFGRATIVGQTSAGAAHAIDFLEVDDNYGVQVPVMYNIHPVTKTDWEGTGVIPHIKTEKEDTLKEAYRQALDQLIERSDYEKMTNRYLEIKAKLNNK